MRLRRTLPTVALASSLLVGGFGLPQPAKAQDIHLRLGTSDPYYGDPYYGESNVAGNLLGAFLTGMVNYFGRSEQDVYLLQSRGIYERELPVVFYLARQAGVSPMMVADLRARGYSWSDITYRLGMSSSIYYVPLGDYYGPYASYYRVPRSRWSTLRLSDDAVIGLVNTRFLSDYYRMPADRVLRLRSSGRDFTVLARDFYRPERHGRLRTWSGLAQRREIVQRRDQRESVAVQRRQVRQQRELLEQQQRMTQRQESNRVAAQRREMRQERELRQQQTRIQQRQESNRVAAQRREVRQQRQQQVQERRQERRQAQAERRQRQRERRNDD